MAPQIICSSPSPLPSSTSLPASATSGSESPASTHQQLSHIDRNSAIALGSILVLILTATAYYVHLKLKEKRQMSLERAAEEQRRDSLRFGIIAGRNERGTGSASFRMNSLWSKTPRSKQDSVSTLVRSDIDRGKKIPWPGILSSQSSSRAIKRVGSVDSTIAPHALDECPFHPQEHSRSPTPGSRTEPLSYYAPSAPSPSARRRSSHRRTSSIHSLPTAFVAEQRRASISQTHNDKRRRDDVTRSGSSSHVNRQFSVLEPILEPEIADGDDQAHYPYTGLVHGCVGPETLESDGEVEIGNDSSSIAGKTSDDWPGSKSRIAVYNWTRPEMSAAEGVERNVRNSSHEHHGGFKGVDWETRSRTKLDEDLVDPRLSS